MGMLVWSGLSVIDGVTPIVVLATGLDGKSSNTKTGGMIQTYIMRSDVSPVVALKTGADVAICGVCPHKSRAAGGTGACYVNVGQGPRAVWQHWADGKATAFDIAAFAGRRLRIGSYGDPAAVPFEVWQSLADVADGVTGYTHQWNSARLADAGLNTGAADGRFAVLCMASADSADEGRMARSKGYRSFIVRSADTPKPAGAVVCPASAEGGKRTVCAACMQCGGTGNGRRSDVTIIAHGATKRSFRPSLPLSIA